MTELILVAILITLLGAWGYIALGVLMIGILYILVLIGHIFIAVIVEILEKLNKK